MIKEANKLEINIWDTNYKEADSFAKKRQEYRK